MDDSSKDCADLIVGASIKEESVGEELLGTVSSSTKIYDLGIGNFSSKFLKGARDIGASIYRIDIRAGISSAILGILETDYLISKMLGSGKIKGIEIVSGGIMGEEGAIVLDDIHSPTYVVGVADGKGALKYLCSKKEQANVDFIHSLIQS
jgi:hypothetical protein